MKTNDKSWEKWHAADDAARDVVPDGMGNTFSRTCPVCKSKSVMRVAHGVCRCTRCGK